MSRHMLKQLGGIALCLLIGASCAQGTGVTLVQNGRPAVALILPPAPAPDETLAAQELQSYLERISGATLPLVTAAPADVTPILIGSAAPDGLLDQIKPRGADPASFALIVTRDRIALRGLSPEGTLFAAYELLEQLGVRWFMPGELGTVVPSATTLSLAEQTTIQVPSFPGRWHNGGVYFKQWGRHVRMGGPFFPSSHGIALGKDAGFEKHPEYYGLIKGQRTKGQLCVSNPEVIRLATEQLRAYFQAHAEAPWIGLGPNDGSGFCECDNCRALDGGDWDPFSAEPSMTDRYVWFFNQLLKGLEPEFADKKICFYAYHTYMRPPVKTKPDPRIVPALAVIALCRIHGPDNPVCPEKNYWTWLAREWKKLLPEVYDRGYWFNLADPGFPFGMVHRLREEVPLGKQLGLAGWRVETANHWGSETPSLYLAAKLMWDAGADVDELRGDFYARFFERAAMPMMVYDTLMDAALQYGNYHTGSSWDLAHLYPAALRAKAEMALNEAARLSGPADGLPARRVRLFRQSFESLQAFIRMMEARNARRFDEAYAQLRRLEQLQDALLAYDPPMIHPRMARPYLDRFFSEAIEQGHERTTGGNRMIAALGDGWECLLVPDKLDDNLAVLLAGDGWAGNWQWLKTSSQSWSDQGLRYYKGMVLYRQNVAIPAVAGGRKLMFWCGGVDERATTWINGVKLGESDGRAFVPFEFEATQALRPGENTIIMRVVNAVVDELGTGGITGPVMIYAPAGGPPTPPANTPTQSD